MRARVLLLVAALLLGAADAAPAPKFGRSVLTGADPSVLVEDGRFWLYPTGEGDRLDAWTSTDLSAWTRRATLLKLGEVSWARGADKHYLWAPHMTAAAGRYFLYYSVGPQEPRPSRIGVATCDTPAGPCRDSGKPLLDGADAATFSGRPAASCPDATPPSGHGRFHFEAIDPMVFVDPRSGRALLYAGGSNGSTLRVFELSPDMVSIARELPVDQPPCFTEGVWMHQRRGIYYLSYSSGRYDDASYSVRYAVSLSPTGPWRYGGVLLRSDRAYKGPGHHAFIQDPRTGEWLIAYHRWEHELGNGPYHDQRKVALAPVHYRADGAIEPIDMEAER